MPIQLKKTSGFYSKHPPERAIRAGSNNADTYFTIHHLSQKAFSENTNGTIVGIEF